MSHVYLPTLQTIIDRKLDLGQVPFTITEDELSILFRLHNYQDWEVALQAAEDCLAKYADDIAKYVVEIDSTTFEPSGQVWRKLVVSAKDIRLRKASAHLQSQTQ